MPLQSTRHHTVGADPDSPPCHYCGDPAKSIDHVVPRILLSRLLTLGDPDVQAVLVRFGRTLTVDACLECNRLLNDSYQDTLAKRKAELKRRLRRRYRKVLSMPEWSDRELSQVSGRLQQYVIASVAQREALLRRLAY